MEMKWNNNKYVPIGVTGNLGRTSLITLFLLLSLALATSLAIYFSAPDRAPISELFNTVFTQTESTGTVVSLNDPNAFDNKVHPVAVNKPESFFTKIISNLSRSGSSSDSSKSNSQTPLYSSAEQQRFLDDSYAELHGTQYSNNQDGHLPSISGRVLSPQGKPIKGIVINATLRDYFNTQNKHANDPQSLTAVSNASGFFAFRDLADGIYLLGTENNKRYLPKRIEVRTGVKYADMVLTELQTLALQGKVIDARSGQALQDVHITPLTKGVPGTDSSDADGQFELEFDIGDRVQVPLRLQKKGYRTTRFSVDANAWDSHQNLLIELEASSETGQLSGLVKGVENEYMDGHLVQLYSPSLKVNYKSKTNNVGEYQFNNIEEANDYRLWVRPTSGYQDFSLERLTVNASPVTQDIQLTPLEQGYRLSGQVVDLDNKPVANISLALRSVNARNQIIPVTTDRFGAYSVENVPGGELVIESHSAPYFSLSGIELKGDSRSAYRDLVVDSGHQKLLGKVVDASGDPVAAPRIFITSSNSFDGMRSQASRKTSADADGKFLFTDLGADQYTVTVNAPGYEGVRIRHNLRASKQLTVRLNKKPI